MMGLWPTDHRSVWYKYTSFARRGDVRGAGIPPPEGIDKMLHVLFQELIDNAQGVFIGGGIEIKGSAEKMLRGIGEEELVGGSGIAANVEVDAANAVGGLDHRLIDGACLIGMFEGHFESVFPQLIEFVWSYGFVADINTCSEPGEIDVDPIGILGHCIEKAAVPDDIRIHRIFERIWKSRLIKGLILMAGEIYFEIAPSFGSINAVTGNKKKEYQRKTKKGHQSLVLGLWPDGYFYFLYSTAVGIQDGKFKIPGVNDIIDLGNIAGDFQNKPGKAITVPFDAVKGVDGQVHGLADIVEHGPAFEDIAAVIRASVTRFLFIEFVPDIAYDLFQDVFQRNDSAGAPEFIYHDREMDLFLLEFLQQVFDEFVFVDKIDRAQQAVPVEVIRFGEIGDKIPAVDHTGELIQAAFVDGTPGIMQLVDPLFELRKGEIVAYAADFQPCPHNLADSDATEFYDAFEDISFFFRPFFFDRLFDLSVDEPPRLLETEKPFETFGLGNGPIADAAEQEVYEFDDARSIIGKLQIVLCSPDLGHDLAKKDHDKSYKDHFYQEFEQPEVLFEQDHLIDKEVGQNDNGNIDDAVGDEHGGQQSLGILKQGDDTSPGCVLFCLQDIDILIGK
jgi:hypothetical protein